METQPITKFESGALVWLCLLAALVAAVIALDRLGPEPELGAADYKQMQCQYMPDAPECRVKRVQIAGK